MKKPAKLQVGVQKYVNSDSGVDIHYEKYGRVVSVYCGTGKFTSAYAANAKIFNLPEGFRPSSVISTPDYGTNGERVRILPGGNIQPWVAKAVGSNVIFQVTFIV